MELEVDERDTIKTEFLQEWKQPMALYMTVIICSIGTTVQQEHIVTLHRRSYVELGQRLGPDRLERGESIIPLKSLGLGQAQSYLQLSPVGRDR
jgi:hypothetical protein